jgi:hypothetical protein
MAVAIDSVSANRVNGLSRMRSTLLIGRIALVQVCVQADESAIGSSRAREFVGKALANSLDELKVFIPPPVQLIIAKLAVPQRRTWRAVRGLTLIGDVSPDALWSAQSLRKANSCAPAIRMTVFVLTT